MNDVHKVVARKLRSAAAALRADAAASNFVNLRDLLLVEIVELEKRADSIEEQVPTVEEPTEFGSIVRAGYDERSDRILWQRGSKGGWTGEDGGYVASFDWLYRPEVLRVGVGPQPLAEWESDLLNFQYRRDTAAAVLMAMDVDQYLIDAVVNATPNPDKASEVAYNNGVSDTVSALVARLQEKRAAASTADLRLAYGAAIRTVEAL